MQCSDIDMIDSRNFGLGIEDLDWRFEDLLFGLDDLMTWTCNLRTGSGTWT